MKSPLFYRGLKCLEFAFQATVFQFQSSERFASAFEALSCCKASIWLLLDARRYLFLCRVSTAVPLMDAYQVVIFRVGTATPCSEAWRAVFKRLMSSRLGTPFSTCEKDRRNLRAVFSLKASLLLLATTKILVNHLKATPIWFFWYLFQLFHLFFFFYWFFFIFKRLFKNFAVAQVEDEKAGFLFVICIEMSALYYLSVNK